MISIELKNISKAYNKGNVNEISVLNNLVLSVEKGETISITGANASGKSTLLKIIDGSLFPDNGNIFFDANDVTNQNEIKRSSIIAKGHQNPSLDFSSELTLEENLIISSLKNTNLKFTNALNKKNSDKVKFFLEEYNFSYLIDRIKSKVSDFSGGQQQIISILMAVISNPQILLLDEPTAGLDSANMIVFIDTIKRIQSVINPTIITISHNFPEIATISNNQYRIENGKLI